VRSPKSERGKERRVYFRTRKGNQFISIRMGVRCDLESEEKKGTPLKVQRRKKIPTNRGLVAMMLTEGERKGINLIRGKRIHEKKNRMKKRKRGQSIFPLGKGTDFSICWGACHTSEILKLRGGS